VKKVHKEYAKNEHASPLLMESIRISRVPCIGVSVDKPFSFLLMRNV